MADQLTVDGRSAVDLLDTYLYSTLTDAYITVYEPTIRDETVSAILVGPQGLFVLHGVDWEGEITPAQHGPWKALLASGQGVRYPSPAASVRRATQALAAFLQDEFPDLRPDIHPFVVLLHPSASLNIYGSSDPPCVPLERLVQEILDVLPGEHPLDTPEVREALATALQERRLTRTQRAEQPFIFRSGRFGRGAKAHTIQQVIQHLDRYPEDGIHHLRNGSLGQWFHDQGALHLARLARETMRQNERDPRVSLEKFLLATGLVQRPRLVITPRQVDLGYVLEGQKVSHRLRLHKGRGRGYLFGTVEPSDTWIQVEPSEFAGSLDAVVTVDTSSLMITEQPSRSRLYCKSSASAEPVEARVLIHVMPLLSRFSRYILHPLVALLLAGLIGTAIGLLLSPSAVQAPPWLLNLTRPPVPSRTAWAVVSGLFWAILGAVRGYSWNPAWPLWYGLRHWLVRTALWGLALAGVAMIVPPLLVWLFPALNVGVSPEVHASMVLFAATMAILPGTWGDMLSAEEQDTTSSGVLQSGAMRGLARGVIGTIAVLVLLGTLRVAVPLWQLWEGGAQVTTVQGWVGAQWDRLGINVDALWDQYYLRRYDRRAPVRVRANPAATASPAQGEQAP